ncbi:hypothetical protein [Synechococcus sp. CBW1107]|uniref:hypothetical protein n=1 Tax=Synechococcus sp. CBW1107 TaxID=2789857 RepID=UPI002AD3043B|nr:hypothetical protein [Synechococcus sp. CBW1107]CAK6700985.1 hypothetical protein IFHNHDMJ_02975 [Synechococcus sp. CBW1107]
MPTIAASLKAQQLEVLSEVLPPTSEVAAMLGWWREADARYWGGQLRPCWLVSGITPYGHCIGLWSPAARTITLHQSLWNASATAGRGVLVHECCHQAQQELYRHLDTEAKGPGGKWTDTSHRCPSWSRAVEDVIQADGLEVFCPVWRRSTGNQWRPWIPTTTDWLTWEVTSPDKPFDGRRLLTLEESRSFEPNLQPLSQLAETLNLLTETASGKPVEWSI